MKFVNNLVRPSEIVELLGFEASDEQRVNLEL
jgi:hypothetical protein